jgi:putative tricarboxylic transport membrane protein
LAGFFFRKMNVPLGPLVLGLILGPMMEANLRRALILSRGDWFGTMTQPLVLFFLLATAFSLLSPLLRRRRRA